MTLLCLLFRQQLKIIISESSLRSYGFIWLIVFTSLLNDRVVESAFIWVDLGVTERTTLASVDVMLGSWWRRQYVLISWLLWLTRVERLLWLVITRDFRQHRGILDVAAPLNWVMDRLMLAASYRVVSLDLARLYRVDCTESVIRVLCSLDRVP